MYSHMTGGKLEFRFIHLN